MSDLLNSAETPKTSVPAKDDLATVRGMVQIVVLSLTLWMSILLVGRLLFG